MVEPKPDISEPKPVFRREKELKDGWLRGIGIPFFGLSIPHFTGLFGQLGAADVGFWLGHLYFVGVAWAIWEGNRWLLFRQREHHDWFSNPIRKLITLVAANVFYTAPLTVLLIWGWYQLSGIREDWTIIRIVTLVNVICVIFVTHIYETVFLIKERQGDQLEFEQLARARVQAELEALKNQIDPHFMFNSLNTLSYLIENDREKALLFSDKLADVYRYILMNKDRTLIPLKEEMAFLNNYFTLLELRFGRGLDLEFIQEMDPEPYLIPPISLQVLMENAVKHNEFDERHPLKMHLRVAPEKVTFSNPKKVKASLRHSSKIGLKNLNERYRLVTGQEIMVNGNGREFIVEMPLLRTVV